MPTIGLLLAAECLAASQTELKLADARKFGRGFALDAGNEMVVDTLDDETRHAGAQWTLPLDQKTPGEFAVTAEGFVEKTDGRGLIVLYVDAFAQDGTPYYGMKAGFDRLISAGWNSRTVRVAVDKPLKSATVFLFNRGTASRARFRPPRVRMVDPSAHVFDGVETERPIRLDRQGFLLRDYAAGGGFVSADGEALGVRIGVTRSPLGGGDLFDVRLRETTGRDRAVTLAYAVPLPEGELTWHMHPRESMKPGSERREFRNASPAGCGAGGLSRWPFAAVSCGGEGRAIGIDTSAPAYFRTALNPEARILYIAFDLGFAPEKRDAHIRFATFPFNAADAFRGAFEAYMALFPSAFEVRMKEHGIWMAFAKISQVKGWRDFGFKIKEKDDEVAWDDANGILTFRYTEPGTWWMKVPGWSGDMKPTFDECVAMVDKCTAEGHALARAWKSSVTRNEAGMPDGKLIDAPWCKGMVWSYNSAPGIQDPDSDFNAKIGDKALRQTLAGEFPEGLDGEYVDSVNLYVTSVLDFDRRHFSAMDTPLCFSSDTARPGIFRGMVAYEYVRSLAERLHPRKKLVMSNSTPRYWCWIAPYSDVMGDEIDWHENGKWHVGTDEEMMLYKMAMGCGKPICYLMNTNIHDFPHELVERYFKRTVAYGALPSFFSGTVAGVGKSYFLHEKYVDRDRNLFKKYIPVAKRLSEAGWRPVCRIVSGGTRTVWTEQFGENLFTVFNGGDNTASVRLSVTGGTHVRELLSGGEARLDGGALAVSLSAEGLLVYEVLRIDDIPDGGAKAVKNSTSQKQPQKQLEHGMIMPHGTGKKYCQVKTRRSTE